MSANIDQAKKIEITPQMIQAGADALIDSAGLALVERIAEERLQKICVRVFSLMCHSAGIEVDLVARRIDQ